MERPNQGAILEITSAARDSTSGSMNEIACAYLVGAITDWPPADPYKYLP